MGQGQSAPSTPTLPAGHPPVLASVGGQPPAQCPMHRDTEVVNPANNMPHLSQNPAPNQTVELPVQRTESSIPRTPSPDGSSVPARWEYPSPQQFYNALARKGWETPEEHVVTMVEIHNFLNEMAWKEVLRWETMSNPYVQHLAPSSRSAYILIPISAYFMGLSIVLSTAPEPQLSRFQGRPGEISPKARFWLLAGRLFPSRFNTEPPFDRHDWMIRRHSGEEVRYVIDYYSAPPEPDGSPVFSLDVRPALDSLGSVKSRITAATREAWVALREQSS